MSDPMRTIDLLRATYWTTVACLAYVFVSKLIPTRGDR